PRLRQRGGVIALDPLRRVGQRVSHRRLHRALAGLEVRRAQRQAGCRGCAEAVEARGVLDERRVAAGADVGHDRLHRPHDVGRHRRRRAIDRAGHTLHAQRARVEHSHWSGVRGPGSDRGWPGPGAAWLRRMRAMRRLMAAYSVFMAARLTMRRAVERVISATSTRPFTRSVSPDCTRSTMRSARPTSGASSTEPSSRTISTWTPRAEKYCSVSRGYLV